MATNDKSGEDLKRILSEVHVIHRIPELEKNLLLLQEAGRISILLDNLTTKDQTWDGEVRVKLDNISMHDLVNGIIAWTDADHIRLESDNVLVLYWNW